MPKKPKKGSWIVRLRCEVIKEVVCDDCTEEEARSSPFQFSDGDELEIDMPDWEVTRVEPND